MPPQFLLLLRTLSKYGGIEITFFLLMLVYVHIRGYSDTAALEFASASVFIAGISHALPSPLNVKETTITVSETKPETKEGE